MSSPETAVRYFSKTGHTEAVGIAIGEALNIPALPISDPLPAHVDLLFLGGAMYAFRLARPLREFIEKLTPEQVGAVAVFSTAGNPSGASRLIEKACARRGLNVLPDEYHCKGDKATTAACRDGAAAFAKSIAALQENDS